MPHHLGPEDEAGFIYLGSTQTDSGSRVFQTDHDFWAKEEPGKVILIDRYGSATWDFDQTQIVAGQMLTSSPRKGLRKAFAYYLRWKEEAE